MFDPVGILVDAVSLPIDLVNAMGVFLDLGEHHRRYHELGDVLVDPEGVSGVLVDTVGLSN